MRNLFQSLLSTVHQTERVQPMVIASRGIWNLFINRIIIIILCKLLLLFINNQLSLLLAKVKIIHSTCSLTCCLLLWHAALRCLNHSIAFILLPAWNLYEFPRWQKEGNILLQIIQWFKLTDCVIQSHLPQDVSWKCHKILGSFISLFKEGGKCEDQSVGIPVRRP